MIETIAAFTLKLKDFSNKLAALDRRVSDIVSSQKKEITEYFQSALVTLTKNYQAEIAKIPLPKDGVNGKDGKDGADGKDGKDAVVDYDSIFEVVNEKIDKLYDEKNTDIQSIKSDVKEYLITQFSKYKPRDGIDGKNGKDGVNGADGRNGKDGKSGVGIADIKRDGENLIITLTDGTTKKIQLPRFVIGGGGTKSGGTAGLDPSTLTEVNAILKTDFLIIVKDGQAHKISADNFVKSIFEIGGVGNVTYNGEYIFYNGQPVNFTV